MTSSELQQKLEALLQLGRETEWVEWKSAQNSFDFDDLGKYFSALSNEANLKGQDVGWLLFGVDNRGKVVGTNYRRDRSKLDSLKQGVAEQTNGITFREIHELSHPNGRVILFEIPLALKGIPTSWKGHFYGRNGESIVGLSLQKIETIRSQAISEDWSAKVVAEATVDDLDPEAIARAKKEYANKFPHLNTEFAQWDDDTFLSKVRFTRSGQLTRAALLLLGRPESSHRLAPAVARITWKLIGESGQQLDYHHFDPPLILQTDRVYDKIRNLTLRELPDGTLFPREMLKYDPYLIRESLHNCIAHQDYLLQGRVTVLERPDAVMFTNLGSFAPGSVEQVIAMDAPPERYRNQLLAQIMTDIGMIDTIGSGIKRMFTLQKERTLPLPDYDLSSFDRVQLTIYGKILDANYSRMLLRNPSLSLKTVIALDRVQKGYQISNEESKTLRADKLIEGRKPNYYVAAKVAALTGGKVQYTKNRAFDKQYYQDMIIQFISQHQQASRRDLDELLLDKLPEYMGQKQRRTKVSNLINELANKLGQIENKGSRRKPVWIVKKDS